MAGGAFTSEAPGLPRADSPERVSLPPEVPSRNGFFHSRSSSDMLHVTNGSVALSRLHDLGVPGQIVPWDDVLHEGPVPADLSDEDLRHVRARFLGADADDVAGTERGLKARDDQLRAAASGDEVVLWFEHDLYDQLHVLQVLDQLSRVGSARTARVTAILADDYLTEQPDDQLRAWFEARREVTGPQWEASAIAWRAFRSPDPSALGSFGHPGAWPTLRAAVRRHLQQYPAIRTGLSRTEVQTLRELSGGAQPLRAAFRASNYEHEDANFMGDLGWWYHIRTLITGPRPLLVVVGDRPSDFNDPEWWRDDDDAPALAVTDDGAKVLAGEADRVALNGIDRWLGGVHLVAPAGRHHVATVPLWRWDEPRGTVRLA